MNVVAFAYILKVKEVQVLVGWTMISWPKATVQLFAQAILESCIEFQSASREHYASLSLATLTSVALITI
jgi:hypothetical protein